MTGVLPALCSRNGGDAVDYTKVRGPAWSTNLISMLTALHTLIYSDEPTATRAFFADVLRLPFVSEGAQGDAGVGGTGTGGTDPSEWLIFRTGPSELGVHPTSGGTDTQESPPRHHEVSLVCTDIDATVAELRGRGASFAGEPVDLGFGVGVRLRVPGADDILLYEPKHAAAHSPPDHPSLPVSDSDWEARYAPESIWSGDPNGALVNLVAALPHGRAVDVGCGEGADAVWLAQQGWDVVAIDVAQSALDRGCAAASDRGVSVDFRRTSLLGAGLPPASFDLVTVAYPALLRTPERAAERTLIDLVRRGGRLLLLTHPDFAEGAAVHQHGLANFVDGGDVRTAIPSDWVIEVDERRPRHLTSGAGAGHVDDLVLLARRP